MGNALASRSAKERAPEVGAAVLAEAIDRRSRVSVQFDADLRRDGYTGMIVGATPQHLMLELDGLDANGRKTLESSPFSVSFEVSGTRYAFTARCLAEAAGNDSALVYVSRPPVLPRAERRRSPRRRLREPSRIAIRSLATSPPVDRPATLLNLSLNGLACRLGSDVVNSISINDTLHVSFDLDRPASRFDLTARVTNITEGGSSDQTILGLEFLPDNMSELSRRKLESLLFGTRRD